MAWFCQAMPSHIFLLNPAVQGRDEELLAFCIWPTIPYLIRLMGVEGQICPTLLIRVINLSCMCVKRLPQNWPAACPMSSHPGLGLSVFYPFPMEELMSFESPYSFLRPQSEHSPRMQIATNLNTLLCHPSLELGILSNWSENRQGITARVGGGGRVKGEKHWALLRWFMSC